MTSLDSRPAPTVKSLVPAQCVPATHLVEVFHPSAAVAVRVEPGEPSEVRLKETLQLLNKSEEQFNFSIILHAA